MASPRLQRPALTLRRVHQRTLSPFIPVVPGKPRHRFLLQSRSSGWVEKGSNPLVQRLAVHAWGFYETINAHRIGFRTTHLARTSLDFMYFPSQFFILQLLCVGRRYREKTPLNGCPSGAKSRQALGNSAKSCTTSFSKWPPKTFRKTNCINFLAVLSKLESHHSKIQKVRWTTPIWCVLWNYSPQGEKNFRSHNKDQIGCGEVQKMRSNQCISNKITTTRILTADDLPVANMQIRQYTPKQNLSACASLATENTRSFTEGNNNTYQGTGLVEWIWFGLVQTETQLRLRLFGLLQQLPRKTNTWSEKYFPLL